MWHKIIEGLFWAFPAASYDPAGRQALAAALKGALSAIIEADWLETAVDVVIQAALGAPRTIEVPGLGYHTYRYQVQVCRRGRLLITLAVAGNPATRDERLAVEDALRAETATDLLGKLPENLWNLKVNLKVQFGRPSVSMPSFGSMWGREVGLWPAA